jgi:hypothetical protein
MSDDTSDKLLSGPEIVANFLQTIKLDPHIDESTVNVIEVLTRTGKLTVTNLLKSLEEARGRTKL